MLEKINISKTYPNRILGNKEKNKSNPTFKSSGDIGLKIAKKYLEHTDSVANTRFIQDTATNWLPKAVFTRSLADFGDMTFLEVIESGLFYFAPTSLGKLFKKAYSKATPEKSSQTKKAAIILGCTVIPAAEYGLSFAKNLFTLKVFKKSNFDNIANLNKEKVEDKKQQERVEKSAKKHLKSAGIVSLAGLVSSIVFAKYGHKSNALQKVSKLILEPGKYIANVLKKVGLHSEKTENFLKKYITPDFAGVDEKGRFKLSQGQLLITTVAGFFGYSAAGKDRGKLDQYEVWTRVPFVVLYTVFGSALFDKAFNHIFIKKNIFSDVIKKDGNKSTTIVETKDLKALAEKIAKEKKTSVQAELDRLTKQKAIVTAIPYLFGIVFMGFFLAGITRFWTQYRYNHGKNSPVEKEQRRKSTEIEFEKSSKYPRPSIFGVEGTRKSQNIQF